MQNLESLKKIYCSKNFAKQQKKSAMQVHKRLSRHNWTINGKSARGSIEGSAEGRDVVKMNTLSNATTMSMSQPNFNSQFAKSYGQGGFYRHNIEDVHD